MTSTSESVTTTQASPEVPSADDARRSTDPRVALAIDFGWRMAELFALNAEYTPNQCAWHLLPSRSSLSRADRLELEFLAAAGAAERIGVDVPKERFEELRELAVRAAARTGDEAKFRDELVHCHVVINKQLWTRSESEARAYELGIMLSDTYNRISRADHEHPDHDSHPEPVRREWRAVFEVGRVRTLKTLLDNLQSQLDPGAVAVVRDHVETWSTRVGKALPDRRSGRVPSAHESTQLRRQTAIWRQLLTGDKEPEAFLDPPARARVRDELLHLMWRRYWRWAGCLFLALFAASAVLLVLHADVTGWYSKHAALLTSVAVSLAGALGISKASINRGLKQNLRTWSTLLWNRALTRVVCTETLRVDRVFPKAACRRASLAYAVRQRFGSPLSPSPNATPSATPHGSSARV